MVLNTTEGQVYPVSAQAGAGTAVGLFPVVISSGVVATGSASGAGEVDAVTYTMPANTLNADGHSLEVIGTFKHAANTNSASAWLKIFGTKLNGVATTGSGGIIASRVHVTRTSSSTASVYGTTVGTGFTIEGTFLTGLDFTTALTVIQRISATGTNDMLTNSLKVVWHPNAS